MSDRLLCDRRVNPTFSFVVYSFGQWRPEPESAIVGRAKRYAFKARRQEDDDEPQHRLGRESCACSFHPAAKRCMWRSAIGNRPRSRPTMRVRLDDPDRADEFVLFLDAAGFVVDPGGVLPIGDPDGAQARRSLELHLELWNRAHPDAEASFGPPGHPA